MPTVAADAVGWAGATCLLFAYARLSSGRLAVGARYHLLNLAGAVGLAVNGAARHAWPSAALNVVWLGIGVAAMYRARATRISTPPSPAPSTPSGRPIRPGAVGRCVPGYPRGRR